MLSPFRMVCRDFILPESANYVSFYPSSFLRNLSYLIRWFFLAFNRLPTLRRRSVGGADIIDKRIILGKINAGDIPAILGRPVGHLADHIHHSGDTNLNLVFLLTLRLGERHGIRSFLLAGTDSKLLILRFDQHLDVRCVVQFGSGLVVELQNIAGDGGNGCGAGLNEVDDSEFFQNRHMRACPYDGFERGWSQEWQKAHREILAAGFVKYVCEGYSLTCFQIRNEWMVNHAARAIAVFNGEKSGTKNTIDYAVKVGVPVVHIEG